MDQIERDAKCGVYKFVSSNAVRLREKGVVEPKGILRRMQAAEEFVVSKCDCGGVCTVTFQDGVSGRVMSIEVVEAWAEKVKEGS